MKYRETEVGRTVLDEIDLYQIVIHECFDKEDDEINWKIITVKTSKMISMLSCVVSGILSQLKVEIDDE